MITAILTTTGCTKSVEWDRWDADKGEVKIESIEFVFQIIPSSYGMTSGGPPHSLNIRAIGTVGTHEKFIVNSLLIKTTDDQQVEIKEAKNLTVIFGPSSNSLRLEKGENVASCRFDSAIPFEYNPSIKLRVVADISLVKKEGTVRKILEKNFHPTRIRERASIWKILMSE